MGGYSLVKLLADDTKSNETWKAFSLFYGLHRIGAPRAQKTISKYESDLWEGYWGALFDDRNFWGDSIEDLESFLEILTYLRNRPVIDNYSDAIDRQRIQPGLSETILDEDVVVEPQIWPATLYPRRPKGREDVPLGYKASWNKQGNDVEPEYHRKAGEAQRKLLKYGGSWGIPASCIPPLIARKDPAG